MWHEINSHIIHIKCTKKLYSKSHNEQNMVDITNCYLTNNYLNLNELHHIEYILRHGWNIEQNTWTQFLEQITYKCRGGDIASKKTGESAHSRICCRAETSCTGLRTSCPHSLSCWCAQIWTASCHQWEMKNEREIDGIITRGKYIEYLPQKGEIDTVLTRGK